MNTHPVLVVGAGPVGLTSALALRAQGLPVTILEAAAEGRQRPGSRAIFYHRQTMQLWESIRVGLGWEIANAGLVWSTKRTFWGEAQVYERTYPLPRPGVMPASTNLGQVDTEKILFRHCVEAGVEFPARAAARASDLPVVELVPTPGGGAFSLRGPHRPGPPRCRPVGMWNLAPCKGHSISSPAIRPRESSPSACGHESSIAQYRPASR